MIDRDGPVDPLDPGLRVAERRDELAVAERPVGAAQPGIGGAHDDPDRDQPESGREGERGELLEAVHEAAILPRRRVPTDCDTLSPMTPRRLSAGPPCARPRGGRLRHDRAAVDAAGRRAPAPGSSPRPERLGSAGDDAGPRCRSSSPTRSPPARPGSCSSTSTPRTPVKSAPDRTVKVAFYDLDRDPAKAVSHRRRRVRLDDRERARDVRPRTPTCPTPARGAPSSRPQAPGSPAETVRLTFPVRSSVPTVRVGQPAPASKTPTAADVGGDLTKISTDTTPDPAFYQTSVADALAAHKPFMLVFATPKFCTSQQCGPTLDQFKPIAAAHPEVTFINVEPYQLQIVGRRRSSRSSTRTTSSRRPTSPTSGACCPSRGSSRSTGTGSSAGSYEVTITPAELDAILPVITRRRLILGRRALGRVLEPDRDLGRRPRSDTRRGPAGRSPGARRGGRAGTPRRSRGRRSRTDRAPRPSSEG